MTSSLTFQEIKQKLADYCVYQDRCHKEMEQKMRDFDLVQEAKDEIMIYLIQNNFLNEERFARSFARGKFYMKKWGRQKIANALRFRGIPPNLIAEGFDEIKEEDYWQTARELASKKWEQLAKENIWTKRRKVYAYLLQKGFESEVVREVLGELSEGEQG